MLSSSLGKMKVKEMYKYLYIFSVTLVGVFIYVSISDIKSITPEKEYCLERDSFNRNNYDCSRSFPSFSEWLAKQDPLADIWKNK